LVAPASELQGVRPTVDAKRLGDIQAAVDDADVIRVVPRRLLFGVRTAEERYVCRVRVIPSDNFPIGVSGFQTTAQSDIAIRQEPDVTVARFEFTCARAISDHNQRVRPVLWITADASHEQADGFVVFGLLDLPLDEVKHIAVNVGTEAI